MNQEDHQGTKNNPDGGIKAENIFLIIYIFVLFFSIKILYKRFYSFRGYIYQIPRFLLTGEFFQLGNNFKIFSMKENFRV